MNDSPLARYLVPLRRWWWITVGLVVLAVGITLATLPDQNVTEEELIAEGVDFRATHLLIRNQDAPAQLSFDLISLLARQGELTNRVAQATVPAIDATDVEMVELAPDPNTDSMAITAVQPTPDLAASLATTYADELVAFLDERIQNTIESDLERTVRRLEDVEARLDALDAELLTAPEESPERRLLEAELDSLIGEFGQLRTEERSLLDQQEGLTRSFVTLEEPSPVPLSEDETAILTLPTQPVLRVVLMVFVALLLGFAIVLSIDYLDTKVRTRRQAEDAFGLPVLAELPCRPRRLVQRHPLPAYDDPGGVTAEGLRALRLSLSLAPTWHLTSLSREGTGTVGAKTPIDLDVEPRSIVVTSTLTGDGKSTLVANLAVSIAEGGKRVLVVDCDFRRPAVGELLQVEPELGLRELARVDERPLGELAVPTVAKRVAMVPAGSVGVTPPWFMTQAAELVHRCMRIADVVIFDTGPITLTNEASALLPHVDTSLIVVRSGRVATDQARGTVEQLTQVGAHVSGLVLIGSEGRRRYGYGYYRPDGVEEEQRSSDERGDDAQGTPERRPLARSVWTDARRPGSSNRSAEVESSDKKPVDDPADRPSGPRGRLS